MSIYACSSHGARVKGPLGAVYVSALNGTDRFARRLRLCGPCISEFLTTTGSEWVQQDMDRASVVVPMCSACSKPSNKNSRDVAVFATVYSPGAERADFFGTLHSDCAASFIQGLSLEPS